MSERDEAFLKLQKIWYDKLKKSGFNDIETNRGFLKDWPAQRLRRDYTPERFQEKESYFQIAAQLLWEHVFQNKLENKIWEHHCEGLSLREISEEVRTKKNKMNKDKVKLVISKLSRLVYSRMLNNAEE